MNWKKHLREFGGVLVIYLVFRAIAAAIDGGQALTYFAGWFGGTVGMAYLQAMRLRAEFNG